MFVFPYSGVFEISQHLAYLKFSWGTFFFWLNTSSFLLLISNAFCALYLFRGLFYLLNFLMTLLNVYYPFHVVPSTNRLDIFPKDTL